MLTGWLCTAPHTSLHAQSAPQDSTIQRTENPRLVSAALVLGGVAIGAIASAVVGTLLLRARPIQETDAGVEDSIETSIPGVDV